jgi:RNA polymerase sigma-70 factor (family 1)
MNTYYTNQELPVQFAAGCHKALEAVFYQYYNHLRYFTNSLIENSSQAEDIVVDTFIKLWKLRGRFQTIDNIKAFLYISARNACLDYLRHIQVRQSSHKELHYLSEESNEQSFEGNIDSKMLHQAILQIITNEIKQLPPKMKLIFTMYYLENLHVNEISLKLGLAPSTIRVQKARAVKALKVALLQKKDI